VSKTTKTEATSSSLTPYLDVSQPAVLPEKPTLREMIKDSALRLKQEKELNDRLKGFAW
jgi:hypothetical protein